jgi:hypothetical protein
LDEGIGGTFVSLQNVSAWMPERARQAEPRENLPDPARVIAGAPAD